jgi:hypothetical protein
MRGLEMIPSLGDLQDAYSRLQKQQRVGEAVSPHQLVLWSQWSRFDPRLAEMLVARLSASWASFNPIDVQEALRDAPWPAALGVLLEQVRIYGLSQRAERKRYQSWLSCAMVSILPARGELFFIGQRAFAGKLALADAEFSLRSYRRWGYFGREVLLNKASAREPSTAIAPRVRRRVLLQILRRKSAITVSDYMTALRGAVSRRQAQIDLKNAGLSACGETRSRTYSRPQQSKKKKPSTVS